MQGEHSAQGSFFGMIYKELIPADHLLRQLAAAVDLTFVSETVSDCYCPDNGRPSWDPLILFKVVFLLFDKLRVVSNVEPQFMYDLSDREIEEQINLHLACKSPTRHSRYGDGAWFAGLPFDVAQGRELAERQPEETAPDHSTLCRFRSRLGPEKFQQIFNQIITQTRQAGLVSDRLQIIDAIHLQAKVDLFRLPEPPANTPIAQAPGSPDPDARFGRKSEKKSFYGYPATCSGW